MIRVRTASRLHFGLLNPGAPRVGSWINADGEFRPRRYGGVGLMVEQPGITLRAERAVAWSSTGPMAGRALQFAQRFRESLGLEKIEPLAITVEHAQPEHCGLGTGTQLGLAVAKVIAATMGNQQWDAIELAHRIGRGLRSAVGIHGFDRGGLIVEMGKAEGESISPLLTRVEFPRDWPILVVIPAASTGIHGQAELLAFEQWANSGTELADTLGRIVMAEMLPALRQRDWPEFGESLYQYNARVGDWFASAQGGRYASSQCGAVVEAIRNWGVPGVGQSSWGPALFAIARDVEHATWLQNQIRDQFGESVNVWATKASEGAAVTYA